MSQMQCLFIGGPADGRHMVVECDKDGYPLPTWAVEAYPNSYDALDAARPVARTVVHYEAQQLRDKQGRDYFVYVAADLNLIGALIQGYRRMS